MSSYPPQPPGGYPPPNPPGYGPPPGGQPNPAPGSGYQGAPPPYPGVPPPYQGGAIPPYQQQYAPPQPGQPGYQWGAGMPQYPYADFGQRFLALLLDGLIVFGAFIVAVILVFFVQSVTAIVLLYLAVVVLAILYEPLLTARQGPMNGQTVGMHVMHIRITNLQGGPISAGQAWGRAIFRVFISGSIFWLGYLWMLWDPGKQTWHDKVANTLVLRV